MFVDTRSASPKARVKGAVVMLNRTCDLSSTSTVTEMTVSNAAQRFDGFEELQSRGKCSGRRVRLMRGASRNAGPEDLGQYQNLGLSRVCVQCYNLNPYIHITYRCPRFEGRFAPFYLCSKYVSTIIGDTLAIKNEASWNSGHPLPPLSWL